MKDYDPTFPELTPTNMHNTGVLREITEHLRNLTLNAGYAIKMDRSGYGITISVDEELLGGGAASAAAAAYSGPFAISVKDSDEVTIATGDIYTRYTKNVVAAGDLVTSGTGTFYIYLKVTYVASAYVFAFYGSTTKPTQDASNYYHPLGACTVTANVPSAVVQYQTGDIEATIGRYMA